MQPLVNNSFNYTHTSTNYINTHHTNDGTITRCNSNEPSSIIAIAGATTESLPIETATYNKLGRLIPKAAVEAYKESQRSTLSLSQEQNRKIAADRGHPEAQFFIGQTLLHHIRDISGSEHYLRLAADQGHLQAQYEYGRAYGIYNDEGEIQLRSAYLRRAADQGHLQAQYHYGMRALRLENFVEAADYLHRATEQGDNAAQREYNILRYRQWENLPNHHRPQGEEQLDALREAARAGHEEAQYEYGMMCYQQWWALPVHHTQNQDRLTIAGEYLRAAATAGHRDGELEPGHLEAQYQYGRLRYEQGIIHPADQMDREEILADALNFLRQAANRGHAEAQYDYGMIMLGNARDRGDFEHAREYVHRAAVQGNPRAVVHYVFALAWR